MKRYWSTSFYLTKAWTSIFFCMSLTKPFQKVVPIFQIQHCILSFDTKSQQNILIIVKTTRKCSLGITTTIFRFTDKIFRRYLHYHSVGNLFTNEITDINSPLVNHSSVIFYPSLSPLVIKNIITDGLTNGKNEQKKKLPASFHQQFP